MLIIVLLNLVFGIILDKFAELRSEHKEKVDDMNNCCFICHIDRYTLDRLSKHGFEHHCTREHNHWHYLYLVTYIRQKHITEYTGLELYLAKKIAKQDVSFFPKHRALVLEKHHPHSHPHSHPHHWTRNHHVNLISGPHGGFPGSGGHFSSQHHPKPTSTFVLLFSMWEDLKHRFHELEQQLQHTQAQLRSSKRSKNECIISS